MPGIGARIEQLGWRQGSVLPPELVARARNPNGKPAPNEAGNHYVVVTQSCDLVHGDSASEPWCEVIRCRPVPQADGLCEHGRNARKLHTTASIDGAPQVIELLAHDRYFLPRKLLQKHPPSSKVAIDHPPVLSAWLGRRYSRPALPGRFNDRIKTQKKELSKLLKRDHGLFRAFFLRLSSFDELDPGESYQIKILLVAYAEAFASARDCIADFQKRLEAIIEKCPDIELRDLQVVSDDRTTLKLIDQYVPWLDYDYLTTRDETDRD